MIASLLGGWSIDATTDSYVSLQKLAHYTGVALRTVFRGANIKGLCTPDSLISSPVLVVRWELIPAVWFGD